MRLKRGLIWIAGVNVLAVGIVLNTKTGLGCAAVSSVNYVASRLLPISFGFASSALYLLFVLVQTVLQKKIDTAIALQIPFSIVFGWITDMYDQWLPIGYETFFQQICLLLIAIALTALGIHLFMKADLVYNPVEGMTKVLAQKTKRDVSAMKNILDLSMIGVSLMIGLLFAHEIIGIGAGTVVSALLCGRLLGFYRKIEALFSKREEEKPTISTVS